MFCITFYSYKGGVGRTLALANAALLLAREGKRVLVVDFDLEAPGIPTLTPFSAASDRPGILEFVHKYLDTEIAPDASEFIHKCHISERLANDDVDKYVIDVMPAGQDENYGRRFAEVDWNDLYLHRDGFLLLENLRTQWQDAGYDYVLIDSRTGHTDVGGICTRQLPDAVVAIFFPNEQNLRGLTQVVRDVRTAGARPQPIELVFVASRVPRLDDEHGLLKRRLQGFQEALFYREEQLLTIEHYDSLMLLDQALFVLDRPKSGLARQYEELVRHITQLNLEDALGALSVVNSLNEGSSHAAQLLQGLQRPDIEEKLRNISKLHQNDGLVQYALARAYYRLRLLQDSAIATDRALQNNQSTKTGRSIDPNLPLKLHQLRIRLFEELGSKDEALASARFILSESEPSITMIMDALTAYDTMDEGVISEISTMPAVVNASPEKLLTISRQLTDLPSAARLGATFTERLLQSYPEVENWTPASNPWSVQLSLIAGGRFSEAVAAGEKIPIEMRDLVRAFNTAVARWGRDHRPDLAEFAQVLALFPDKEGTSISDANHNQCLALTHAVLGHFELARAIVDKTKLILTKSQRREFSCWTYFTVPANEFIGHLEAIQALAKGEGQPPEVLVRAWQNEGLKSLQ